jgi:hypothetical protein
MKAFMKNLELSQGESLKTRGSIGSVVLTITTAVVIILGTSYFLWSSRADVLNNESLPLASEEKMSILETPIAEASGAAWIQNKKNIQKKQKNIVSPSISTLTATENISFESVLNKPIPTSYTNVWGRENMKFAPSGELDVFFPKGSYSPGNSPIVGGAGFIYLLWKQLDSATLSYQVMFDPNFNFVKWGKLPGLCSGKCPRWGAEVGDDFSTRFMWRANGDLELYAYIPKKQETYGKSFGRGSYRFQTGKYYTISQTITLNTPGKSDGILQMSVDGVEVFRDSAVIFRETAVTHIDSILFSTFFWWSDATWATPVDTHIHFKGFTLSH